MARLVGWQEWVSLPELGVDRVKVKVDTGARTSALHAANIVSSLVDGEEWVTFTLHPLQENTQVEIEGKARVAEHRSVRDSGGHEETRVVIETTVELGGEEWQIELTLTDREHMGFRMLLGRNAIRNRFYVDPTQSFILTTPANNSENNQEEE